jgi:hypothetical protein
MPTQAPPVELLTPMQAAFRLNRSLSFVYRLLRDNAVDGVVETEAGVRIPASGVDAYAEARAARDAEAAIARGPADEVIDEAARTLLGQLIEAGHLPPHPPPAALNRIAKAIRTAEL